MKFEPIEVIENPFYFGIGGIGDFLLLMATFYDDVDDNTDVIFVCNSVNAIRAVSTQFPKIHRFWFYPMSAFNRTTEMWRLITRSNLCKGTGVTPKAFKYVEDWIECGNSNVFDYYGVIEHPKWCEKTTTLDHITIQPNGGADGNRVSIIEKEKLESIIEEIDSKVYLIGSKSDVEKYGEISGSEWVVQLDSSFEKIRTAKFHLGVNSWCKTYAGLSGVETIIYPSTYNVDPQELFGCKNDPSDYVFLKPAGWKFLDWEKYHANG